MHRQSSFHEFWADAIAMQVSGAPRKVLKNYGPDVRVSDYLTGYGQAGRKINGHLTWVMRTVIFITSNDL
jgi:hypothetical protein